MTEQHDEHRKIGRRKKARRIADLAQDILTEGAIQAHDKQLYSKYLNQDRRVNDRRSGKDRREE